MVVHRVGAVGLAALLASVLAAFEPPATHAQTDENCHPSYPNVCIPPPPPDLDCGDLDACDIEVVGSDPHRLDRDRDGIACECR